MNKTQKEIEAMTDEELAKYKKQLELEKQTKKERRKVRRRNICILGLIIIIILLLLSKCSSGEITPPPVVDKFFTLQIDDNAGKITEEDKEKIVDELNNKLSEGMIRISCNTTPIFEDGTSLGKLNIINETENNYPQVVEIYIADTNELIYQSALIPVGEAIEYDTLNVDLDAGEYPCTISFYAVDETTGKMIGQVNGKITVTVKA